MEKEIASLHWDQILTGSETGYMVFSQGESGEEHKDTGSFCIFANPAAMRLIGSDSPRGQSIDTFFSSEKCVNKSFNQAFVNSGLIAEVRFSQLSPTLRLYTLTELDPSNQATLLPEYCMTLWEEAEQTMLFGSWLWDFQSDTVECSKGLYKLLGYSEEMPPNPWKPMEFWKRHIFADELTKFEEVLKLIPSYTDTYVLEFRGVDVAGNIKKLYLKGKNVPGIWPGSVISTGITFDISFLKQMRGELEGKVNDLNKSNTELEQFAYVASHDLQEPLRKIVSFGERLDSKLKDQLNEEQKHYMDRILSATRRMQGMIHNLLEFSRITRSESKFQDTDLNVILKECLSDLEIRVTKSKAQIHVLPLPVIEAIPWQMSQLFTNLISNALKFVRKDVVPVISIKGIVRNGFEPEYQGSDVVEITIEDNGIGFDNEQAEKIFTLFHRLRGRSEFEGSGIGLSVCSKVVEVHGGSISASGVLNEGAKFIVILPIFQKNI